MVGWWDGTVVTSRGVDADLRGGLCRVVPGRAEFFRGILRSAFVVSLIYSLPANGQPLLIPAGPCRSELDDRVGVRLACDASTG